MERREKIDTSKYNRWYKYVNGEGVPEYLKKGWGESRWKGVARFRLGCSIKGRKYWEGEEKRKCRLYEREEETWEHIWEECCRWGEGGVWQEKVEEILGEKVEGENEELDEEFGESVG